MTEIKLNKEENVKLIYLACPRCHNNFDLHKHKKTQHHAIPSFLKPKTEILITLCLTCHEELNSFYRSQKITYLKDQVKSKTFKEFKDNYEELREKFNEKLINRGQFGEGLWSNLVSYLEAQTKK